MISANELKKGNLVSFINKQGVLQIDSVDSILKNGSVYTKDYEFRHDEEDLIPIPLTPEILKSCSIKKYPQSYYKEPIIIKHSIDEAYRVYSKNRYIVFKQYDEYNFLLYGVGNNEKVFCELFDLDILFQYLHQFQNLYLPLIGQELEIKPNA